MSNLGGMGTVVFELRDWHTPLPPMMLAMTVSTGLVDSFSFLVLGHVFVANMTGNVVFSSFALAGAPGFTPGASLAALAAFVTGAFVGGVIAHRSGAQRGVILRRALFLETILVFAAYLVAANTDPAHQDAAKYALIAVLGIALGGQNATARTVAVPDLTTTVLTLTITGIVSDSRAAGGHDPRLPRRLLATAALFIGGLAGAFSILNGIPSLPLLLATLLLAGVTVASFRLTKSGEEWARPV
uniref:YoaK family protein n=1 Tax=Streptomyces corallincola TaxID=2851888 RepID=UPI0027E38EF3|nr:YoaK family protein [Streptomyces corallincola]